MTRPISNGTPPDDAAASDLPEPPPQSFLPQSGDPGGVRALKFAIIGMGMLIVIGLFAIAAKMIALSQGETSDASKATRSVAVMPTTVEADATGATTASSVVPFGAVITHTALDGKRLAVTYRHDGGEFVAIVDIKSGEIWRRLRLTPKAP